MLSPDKVSIVCPNYNKAPFIAEAIKSVLNNSYAYWELIIIDDGSTDDSISIIEQFAEQDNRIVLIKQINQGGAIARNKGMSMASGEYLLFMDSDDLISKDCIENRLFQAKKNPNGIGWVFPLLPFEGDFSQGQFHSAWLPPMKDFLESFISHEIAWATPSVLWKTESIAPYYQWNSNYPRLQDIEFHTNILLNGGKIFTYPDHTPDCYYRLDEQRIVLGNRYQYLEKWAIGCSLYIHEFWSKVPAHLAPKLSRTALAFLSVAGHYYRAKQIDKRQFQSLLERGINSTPLINHQRKLKWYGKLLQNLPFHLPGMNAFFKFWIR